jgi:uncharacterized membrane protein YhdT
VDNKPSHWEIIKSVLASFIGVQSEKNRLRDFAQGKPSHFIIAGLLLTVVFILVVWGVVKLVLSVAGI